jgi:hypothetical protein
LPKGLQINVALPAMNSRDPSEELCHGNRRIRAIERITLGYEDRIGVRSYRGGHAAKHAVRKNTGIAFEENHVPKCNSLKIMTADKDKIAMTNPREHAAPKYTNTGRPMRTDLFGNGPCTNRVLRATGNGLISSDVGNAGRWDH